MRDFNRELLFSGLKKVNPRGADDAKKPRDVEPTLTMAQANSSKPEFAEDSAKLLESAIASNLELTPEERIEAHENARQLMTDLQSAGKALRAAESQSSP
jgi:hypothetical protein